MRMTGRFLVVIGILGGVPAWLLSAPLKADLDHVQGALGVPSSIAKVTDGALASGAALPEVILIQDVHRHPEVQGYIAAILIYGTQNWGLKDVYLEGASASAPVAVPKAEGAPSLYDALLDGRLSGAEMAAALAPDSSVTLHGLEETALYRKNVAVYKEVKSLREPALRELNTARFLQRSLDVTVVKGGTDRWDLLERLLELRLKPAERAAYLNEPYHGEDVSALNKAVRAAEEFYAIADQRSSAFLKTVERGKSPGPKLVVVGGYHTAAMAQELRREGRSFAVLTPNVTQSGYDELYERGMQQTISALQLR